MMDATGRPQSLLLLGGSSEIALAVAEAWAEVSPDLRVVHVSSYVSFYPTPSPTPEATDQALW